MSAKSYLLDRISQEPNTGCWLWMGSYDQYGYGKVSKGDRFDRHYSAHKAAYLTFVGPVEAGLELDHGCGCRACCNPAHLEPVDCNTNTRRGVQRAKVDRSKYQGRKPKWDHAALRAMHASKGWAATVRETGVPESTLWRALKPLSLEHTLTAAQQAAPKRSRKGRDSVFGSVQIETGP